jgi:hypothetical protein
MMSHSLHELAKVRIRKRNPDFDEPAILAQLVLELYGSRRDA